MFSSRLDGIQETKDDFNKVLNKEKHIFFCISKICYNCSFLFNFILFKVGLCTNTSKFMFSGLCFLHISNLSVMSVWSNNKCQVPGIYTKLSQRIIIQNIYANDFDALNINS